MLRSDQDRVAHFKGFLEQLVEKFQPVRIISFGKQTIQNEITGCFGNKQVKHQHYCLLMVTESSTRIDYEVQDFSNKHDHNGQITIVCHGETSYPSDQPIWVDRMDTNIIRFQNALNIIKNSSENRSLSDIAFECGYYDHSHLNNEIKRNTGLSPSLLKISDFYNG